jgi:hypothetical protein
MGDPEPFAAFVRRVAPEHAHLILAEIRGAVEALRFYAEEDSEFDVGGADGGRRALEVLDRLGEH